MRWKDIFTTYGAEIVYLVRVDVELKALWRHVVQCAGQQALLQVDAQCGLLLGGACGAEVAELHHPPGVQENVGRLQHTP